jgi:hypothetical protein
MAASTKDTMHQAFIKAQFLIGGARKSAKNDHFKSKYATLEDVMDACQDILNEHDFYITQPVMIIEGDYVVRTILTHMTGDTIQDHGVPLTGWREAKNPSQALVAATTYARRCGLSSLVGITPEDDDGNSSTSNKPKEKPADKPKEAGPEEPRALKVPAETAFPQWADFYVSKIQACTSNEMVTAWEKLNVDTRNTICDLDNDLSKAIDQQVDDVRATFLTEPEG